MVRSKSDPHIKGRRSHRRPLMCRKRWCSAGHHSSAGTPSATSESTPAWTNRPRREECQTLRNGGKRASQRPTQVACQYAAAVRSNGPGKRLPALCAFSLDLLAHDLGRDRVVIIENQIKPTNYDHSAYTRSLYPPAIPEVDRLPLSMLPVHRVKETKF